MPNAPESSGPGCSRAKSSRHCYSCRTPATEWSRNSTREHDAVSYAEPPQHPFTFWGVVEWRAAQTPDLVMLEDDHGRSMTFAEYRDGAEAVAAGLAARGVGSGSVVSWRVATSIEAARLVAARPGRGAVAH